MIEMGGNIQNLKNGDSFSFTEDSILIQDLLEYNKDWRKK